MEKWPWKPIKITKKEEHIHERLDFIDKVNNEKAFIPKRASFKNTKTIYSGKEIRVVDKLVSKYGGEVSDWEKKVGKIESDKYIHDLHWYENDKKQYNVKLKTRKEKKK